MKSSKALWDSGSWSLVVLGATFSTDEV